MNKRKSWLNIIGMSLTVTVSTFVPGCGGGGGGPSATNPPLDNTATLRENTKILPADGSVSIVQADATHVSLSGSVPTLKAGDVIVSSTGQGLLAKVQQVQVSGGTTNLTISPATLEDALENINAEFRAPLTPTDVQSLAPAPNVRISISSQTAKAKRGSEAITSHLSVPLTFDISQVIYDRDKNLSTKADQLSLKLSLKDVQLTPYLKPQCDFLRGDYKVESGVDLEGGELEFALVRSAESDIETTRSLAGIEIENEKSLLAKPIEKFVVLQAGPLTIPGTVKTDVLVSYTLKFDFNLKPTLRIGLSAKLGAGYDNGRIYSIRESNFTPTLDFGRSNLFDGEVKLVAPKFKINWFIAGLAGPFGTLGFYDKATVRAFTAPPKFTVSASVGATGGFGAETRFISSRIPRFESSLELEIAKKEFEINVGSSPTPTPTVGSTPTPSPTLTPTPYPTPISTPTPIPTPTPNPRVFGLHYGVMTLPGSQPILQLPMLVEPNGSVTITMPNGQRLIGNRIGTIVTATGPYHAVTLTVLGEMEDDGALHKIGDPTRPAVVTVSTPSRPDEFGTYSVRAAVQ